MMPNKKNVYLKYSTTVLIIGIAASIAIPFLFYKSLNRVINGEPLAANTDSSGVISNFDDCQVRGSEISVRGWASPKDGYGDVQVFAKINGENLVLRTSQVKRPDVSAYFSKPGMYDKSGFSAGLNYGRDIEYVQILLQVKKDSRVYVVSHDCK